MRHKRFIFCAVLFFAYGLFGLQAQDAIPATGGSVSVIGQGSVSYTVGQVLFTTNNGATGSVMQGVQQPFEISVLSGMEKGKDIGLSFLAYPNPFTDYLTLKADFPEDSNLSYQLFNDSGEILEYKILAGNEADIEMGYLRPAVYFLKVFEDNREVKTFKIIKKD